MKLWENFTKHIRLLGKMIFSTDRTNLADERFSNHIMRKKVYL